MVFEMEEINDDWDDVDVTLVIGGTIAELYAPPVQSKTVAQPLYLLFSTASDTVSSAAEDDPNCSIYGMPVLRVWKSEQVYVLKRSIGNTGCAGMMNPILFKSNTDILLGDAKESLEALRTALSEK